MIWSKKKPNVKYRLKSNMWNAHLPCPRAGCQRFRSMSASRSMWFIELAVLLKIWFSAVVPLLSPPLGALALATPFRLDLPSSQQENTLSKYCTLIMWWWFGQCVEWDRHMYIYSAYIYNRWYYKYKPSTLNWVHICRSLSTFSIVCISMVIIERMLTISST